MNKFTLPAESRTELEAVRTAFTDAMAEFYGASESLAAIQRERETVREEKARLEKESERGDRKAVAKIAQMDVELRLIDRDVGVAESALAAACGTLRSVCAKGGVALADVASAAHASEITAGMESLGRFCSKPSDAQFLISQCDKPEQLRSLAVMLRQPVPTKPEILLRVAKERLRAIEDLLNGQWPWPQ